MPGDRLRSVEVVAVGPVATAAVLWRLRGQLAATVIVKASFALVPDGEMEPVDPEPILGAELHHGNSPARSVRATSDLAPFLPRADVLLTGHAVAPAGRKVTRQVVRLAVYRDAPLLDKTLYVYGDRAGGEPRPFDRIPLVYERAYGGIGWADNPLGTGSGSQGHAARPPNIEVPRRPGVTGGFGPISRSWPARRRLLGGLDRRALDAPILELPDAFDLTYFQAAPPDQRIDHLIGDEWVVIDGMHPELESVQSCLPGAHAEGLIPGAAVPLVFRADTLLIDADQGRCSLVWRAVVPVSGEEALAGLYVLCGVATRDRPIPWPAPPAAPERRYEGTVLLPVTAVLDDLGTADLEPSITETDPDPVLAGGELPAERTLEITAVEAPPAPIPFAPAASGPPASSRPRPPIPGAPWSGVPAPHAPESPHETTITITPREIAAMPAPAQPWPRRPAPPRAPVPPSEAPPAPAASASAPLAPALTALEPPALEPPASEPPAPEPAQDADPRRALEARLRDGVPLTGLPLAGADLSGLDLSGRSLADADLSGARLAGCRLARSCLSGANLTGADLTGADLTGADLTRATLDDADLERAELGGAQLDGASFFRARLPGARLHGAKGRGARFDEATLDGVRAEGAALPEASLRGVRADRSTWDKATLDGATFDGAALSRASFTRASADRASFEGAVLVDAHLARAKLTGARLARANLTRASLEAADLTDADLTGANLHAAETWKAKLGQARLEGALLTQTKLKDRS